MVPDHGLAEDAVTTADRAGHLTVVSTSELHDKRVQVEALNARDPTGVAITTAGNPQHQGASQPVRRDLVGGERAGEACGASAVVEDVLDCGLDAGILGASVRLRTRAITAAGEQQHSGGQN